MALRRKYKVLIGDNGLIKVLPICGNRQQAKKIFELLDGNFKKELKKPIEVVSKKESIDESKKKKINH